MEGILQLTPVPTLVLDSCLVIRQVSKGFGDVTRRSASELLGKALNEALDLFPFADEAVLDDIIEHAIEGKCAVSTGDSNIEPLLLFDRYWHFRVVPIFDQLPSYSHTHDSNGKSWDHDALIYIIIELMDVTTNFACVQQLRRELQTCEPYRLLVHTVKDYAIFMLDETGHVETWNTGAQILKQYTPDDIIGCHFRQFYSKEAKAAKIPEMELEVAVREGKFEDSGWRYKKDGSKFFANVIITPSYRDDKLVGFTKVTRDMTQQRAAETRLIAEYEEASKLKSQFLANMSHELRSPMHGMLSAVTLMTETSLTPEQSDLAAIIEESGSILLHVINDILDFSKLSSGAFQINVVETPFRDIVSAVIKSCQVGLKQSLVLHSRIDPRVPNMVLCDPLRIRQVLQNLLVNAIKFTEQGSVDVDVRVLEEKPCSIEIIMEVIDTGLGIPLETATTLFTPFTQLDNSSTKRYKGTGLGLSICKSLVELMGGVVGFRPNPAGVGSIFWFTVLVTRSENSALNNSVDIFESLSAMLNSNRHKRILLVEDNAINRNVMVKTLGKLGFDNVESAEDGREGVNRHKLGKCDLILMDVSMPILDGVAATKEIRATGSDIPIIAMTANALKGDAERFMAAGMSDYIAKPVDRRLLVSLLAKWLGK
jgi:osomolarity two-component system, sensor histidine kinase TcsA